MSRGQIGKRLDGLDILLLTTRGCKSGKLYETPMPYFTHPDGFLLIASNAGSSVNPAWYHNLLNEPEVNIQLGAKHYPVIARSLTGQERTSWWRELITREPRYAGYQGTTSREIPIVLLITKEPQ